MKKFNIIFSIASILFFSTTFIACSNDDDDKKLDFEDMELTVGDSKTIENGMDLNWKTENEYIATVENGVVKAHKVGKVEIESYKGSFSVTVKPRYNSYREPCMDWGCSVSSIKSFMSGYELLLEDEELIAYSGKGIEEFVGYILKNSKLHSSSVFVHVEYAEELANFLNERYLYVSEEDGLILMVSPDMKIIVILSAVDSGSNLYFNVIYAESASSSNVMSRSIEQEWSVYNKKFNEYFGFTPYIEGMEQIKTFFE